MNNNWYITTKLIEKKKTLNPHYEVNGIINLKNVY